jgi:DNA-binding PadR family transcriptional regulator
MPNPPPANPGSAIQSVDPALTSAQFHILLTLAEGARHGYGIMQEVARRTDGGLELGPGTLYRSIKQLLQRGLIEEVEPPPEEDADGGNRRREYRLTRAGKARTAEEAQRLRELVRWAEDAMVLEGGQA